MLDDVLWGHNCNTCVGTSDNEDISNLTARNDIFLSEGKRRWEKLLPE